MYTDVLGIFAHSVCYRLFEALDIFVNRPQVFVDHRERRERLIEINYLSKPQQLQASASVMVEGLEGDVLVCRVQLSCRGKLFLKVLGCLRNL